MEILIPIIVIAAGLLAVARLFSLRNEAVIAAENPQEPEEPTAPVAGEETEQNAARDESAYLYELANRVEEFARKSAYPTDLLAHPDFQEGVRILTRPRYTTDDLLKYYNGFNFILSCIALEALAQRQEEDRDLLSPILSTLSEKPYWVQYFALRTLDLRFHTPVIGPVVAKINEHWTEAIMQRFLSDFLTWRLQKGETLTFGEALDGMPLPRAKGIEAALKELEAPLSEPLLRELREWMSHAVDIDFLESFGRIWKGGREPEHRWIAHEALQKTVEELENKLEGQPPRPVLLVGESGVGKTVAVNALAEQLQQRGWTIFEASASNLLSGQIYVGQLEERIHELIQKISGERRVLWVVPNIHELMFAGTHRYSPVSVLDMLLPHLERGEMMLLGETQPAAYERLLQTAPRLRAIFETVRIYPLPDEETLHIARKWIELYPDLQLPEETLQEAFQLTRQYLGEKAPPGNLLGFLKLTCARLRSAQPEGGPIGIDDLLVTLSQLTGLPINILDDRQGLNLKKLRETFNRRVMGQPEAVDCLVERVAMIKAGLTDPTRPQGVFLFAGPTGTGKTEIAKTLAGFLFGSEQRMIRLDMSEFQTADSLDRILGGRDTTPDAAGALVNLIRKQPFSVVLLDEFEKAHPNVWDVFLQVFDDGRLTDRQGNTADFRHCIMILTSNLGGVIPTGASIGFTGSASEFTTGTVAKAISRTFRKEFLNRLDRVVVFQPLSRSVMREVLRKELDEVMQRRGLRNRSWAVEFDNSAIEFLLDRGFTADLGARPLKRAIEQYLLSPLAVTIVNHQFPEGDQFLFVRSNGKKIEVEFIDPDLPEPTPAEPAESDAPAATISLKSLVLDARGRAGETEFLERKYREVREIMENAGWAGRKERLLAHTAHTDFWNSPDRFAILGKAEYIDRIDAGFVTAERLRNRLPGTTRSDRTQVSPLLIQRLAQQLYLLEAAILSVLDDRPQDAFLLVEAGRDAQMEGRLEDSFAGQIALMYLQWAEKRRMRHKILEKGGAPGAPFKMMIAVAGYAAFAILEKESGLHVLEIPSGESGTAGGSTGSWRRCKTRVRVVPQPPEPPSNEADGLYRQAREAFSRAAEDGKLAIVRRYRELPSPLVRDSVHKWRTGRLDRVLGGDFDLME